MAIGSMLRAISNSPPSHENSEKTWNPLIGAFLCEPWRSWREQAVQQPGILPFLAELAIQQPDGSF